MLFPGRLSLLTNLANTLLKQKKLAEAVATAEAASAVDATSADALLIAASAHFELGDLDRALTVFDRLAEIAPESGELWAGRGSTLERLGRFDEASQSYDRLTAIDPAHGHYQRALLRLRFGDFAAGWAEHEWRLEVAGSEHAKLQHTAPPWPGGDADGRRILLYAEQGYGDAIQFVRYAPLVAAAGADVALYVPQALRALFAESFTALRVIDSLPAQPRFDFRSPIMSLPHRLGLTSEDDLAGSVPYLAANDQSRAKWRERLGTSGFKIGIVWQGNPAYPSDRERSLPLPAFAPFARLPDVRLISLQVGKVEIPDALPSGMTVERLGPEIEDNPDGFREVAAVMANLDLVVTSDSAPAHLAGALGRPTWVALRAVPDWRWLIERSDLPWYPTMRLFRQAKRGDWASVFDEMATALARRREMAGAAGFEPATYGFGDRRSTN